MTSGRAEPFQAALAGLRARLRDGSLAPGARIAAAAVADDLRLSQTPVREALSRLAGEGLVDDRRGEGFFVRLLTADEIADLYRLSLAQLTIPPDPRRGGGARGPAVGLEAREAVPPDPVREVERLFADWIAEDGSRVLGAAHRSVQAQLGPVRRVEPLLISDLAAEAVALRSLRRRDPPSSWTPILRRFHLRRIGLAERLAAILQRPR